MSNRIKWLNIAALAVLVLALTVIIGRPMLSSALVGGHSAYIDLIRSVVWHEQVMQGEFLPQWIPDFYFGHGSPIFLFYAPASYVLIELFRLVTPSAVWAVKCAYLTIILSALWGMFIFGRRLGGKWGGMAAMTLYGFAPYFLVDLYVRNGIAEFACFAILPWLANALFAAAQTKDVRPAFTFAVLFALLVVTHNITAMITAPILLLLIFGLARKKRLLELLGAYFAGIGLCAWFWLPAMGEKNLVASAKSLTGGFFHYGNHFVFPRQLVTFNWGFGSSVAGPGDKMSFQIGAILLISVVLTVALGIFRRRILERKDTRPMTLLFAVFCIGVFFTTQGSKVFWDHLPLLPFVQFPWRFLLLVVFSGSALCAYLPGLAAGDNQNKKTVALLTSVIMFCAMGASANYVKARYAVHDLKTNKPRFVSSGAERETFLANDRFMDPGTFLSAQTIRMIGATTTASDDYLPLTVKKTPGRYYGYIVEAYDKAVTLTDKTQKGAHIRFSYSAKTPVTVRAEPFYFPGWRANLAGKPLSIHPDDPSGVILIDLPEGTGEVSLIFGDTALAGAGKAISLLTLIVLCALLLWSKKMRVKEAV